MLTVIYGQGLSLFHRPFDPQLSMMSTMLVCRCGWQMKRRGRWWECERRTRRNRKEHDRMRRTPTRRGPCL